MSWQVVITVQRQVHSSHFGWKQDGDTPFLYKIQQDSELCIKKRIMNAYWVCVAFLLFLLIYEGAIN